jgi:hypothetical protein
MPNRSLATVVAVALFAVLALSEPADASSISTLIAVNQSGLAANDFEATFSGLGGAITGVVVISSSGIPTTTKLIAGGTGIEVDFATPLPNGSGVLTFSFETPDAPTVLTADWTFTSGAPIDASGSVFFTSIPAVPEPSSIALLGVGMAGAFSLRRFFRKRPPVC